MSQMVREEGLVSAFIVSDVGGLQFQLSVPLIHGGGCIVSG